MGRIVQDEELMVISDILKMLEGLRPDQRSRVAQHIIARFPTEFPPSGTSGTGAYPVLDLEAE